MDGRVCVIIKARFRLELETVHTRVIFWGNRHLRRDLNAMMYEVMYENILLLRRLRNRLLT